MSPRRGRLPLGLAVTMPCLAWVARADAHRAAARRRGARRGPLDGSRVRRAQLPSTGTGCRSRIEGQPAVAAEPHFDPRVRIVVGHAPHAVLRVIGSAREPNGDTCGHAEIAQHQRHGAGEMLAVAGVRPGHEVDERRGRTAVRRPVGVDEAARRAEPRHESRGGRVRRSRVPGDRGCGACKRRIALELGPHDPGLSERRAR